MRSTITSIPNRAQWPRRARSRLPTTIAFSAFTSGSSSSGCGFAGRRFREMGCVQSVAGLAQSFAAGRLEKAAHGPLY
eukprot:5835988-Pleurochrysis_carterae.AAC.2